MGRLRHPVSEPKGRDIAIAGEVRAGHHLAQGRVVDARTFELPNHTTGVYILLQNRHWTFAPPYTPVRELFFYAPEVVF